MVGGSSSSKSIPLMKILYVINTSENAYFGTMLLHKFSFDSLVGRESILINYYEAL